MTNLSQRTLLVTGGSGHLGRRVIELLLERGEDKIVTTTRTPEKLANLAAQGVEVRYANFDDPTTLAMAFAGVDRLLLISTDTVDGTNRRQIQHRNAINAAEAAGVQHVVYTSLTNPGPESLVTFAPDHFSTEQALANSAMSWTVLRNNLYTDYLLLNLPRALSTGQWMAAAGEGAISYVTREDCARAAAAALTATTTTPTILDITGPDLVTHAEVAQIVEEITGRPLAYVDLPATVLQQGMVAAGLPEAVAAMLVSFDQTTAAGTLGVASQAVAELTGQAPQSVRAFLTAHKAALLAA